MTALPRTFLVLAALAAGTGCGRSMPGAHLPGPGGGGGGQGGTGAGGSPGGRGGSPGGEGGTSSGDAASCSAACHPEAVCAPSLGRASCLQISAGQDHACALVEGKVHCWGGTTAVFPRPVFPQGWVNLGAGRTAVQVSAGRGHVCVLMDDGTVRCWGSNLKGELGTGRNDGQELAPVEATVAPRGLTLLSAGVSATCGITATKALTCWGWSTFNQFALDGTPPGVQFEAVLTPVTSPFFGPDMRDFALSAEPTSDPSCGISGDVVLCHGRFMPRRRYGAAEGISRPARVRVGGGHVCALDGDRRLHCWGFNGQGQVGSAVGVEVERPTAVLDNVRSFALGRVHTCAVTGAGQVMCWGNHAEGALGIGDTGADGVQQPHWKPAVVAGLEPVVQVTAGAQFTCALGTTGKIWCWGSNEAGQLGLPTAERSRNRPVEIPRP